MSSRSKIGVGFTAAAAAALALVLVLSGSGSAHLSKAVTTPCGCAGYFWRGPVDSVSATWKVPQVQTNSVGSAATWIGAETDGHPGRFIQVGVAEGLYVDPVDAKLGQPDKFLYWYAFWSDIDHGDLLQRLDLVQPGDIVHAALSQSGGRWTVELQDAYSSVDVRLSTSQEAGSPLEQADWLQEDIRNGKTGRLGPYPRLSTVRFQDLRVNGAAPDTVMLSPDSLTDSAHLALIPSPVTGGTFFIGAGR